MKFLRLYIRVLALLGSEARLGWALAVANVALASAQFVEPVLFGRIVDTLANAQGGTRTVSWSDVILLVGMWVGFGLFIIGSSTMVALHADRLAHRHSQKVRTDYFEHVLQLPLSYHTGTHSGRLMKIMLTGTNTLWGLWLSFFRETPDELCVASRLDAAHAVHQLAVRAAADPALPDLRGTYCVRAEPHRKAAAAG